jgi:hypothetical protein
MNLLEKIRRWFKREPADPEAQAEADRIRENIETVRTSQFGPAGGSNLPPTPDVTDPDA